MHGSKISIVLLFFVCVVSVFPQSRGERSDIIYVSVPPLIYFVENIVGDTIQVISLVPEATEAELYIPSTQQMYRLSQADAFIGIGMPYEEKLIAKLNQTSPQVYTAVVDKNIERILLDEEDDHGHGDEEGSDDHRFVHSDPHIWLSIKNGPLIVKAVYEMLSTMYPDRIVFFENRYHSLLDEVTRLSEEIAHTLSFYKGQVFLIYHPVLGYIAKEIGLVEVALQKGGHEKSLRQVREITKIAREYEVSKIIVQKGFPQELAKKIAASIEDGEVIVIDPLGKEWDNVMLDINDVLLESLSQGR